ncbi:unnamed protein product [Arabidopsis thaliana]|uniref:AAA+ ATPase domain-containing protein n=1 Tax=Arabidopsis thaliana TaxID=3702 RepID=A0A5S9XI18_ARATH|nr:unnamed protein product [Arabidopsis thaliana]
MSNLAYFIIKFWKVTRHNYIGSEYLLLVLLREGEGIAVRVLESLGADRNNIRTQGKLDPVVGRQTQIKRVVQILARRTCRNNACLIGKPGVGKRAIAEGVAQRIASGDVPETKTVITLDMGLLVAGTKFGGEAEENLKNLMVKIRQSDDIILFIDEMHMLIGLGAVEGAIDTANILKPALERCERQHIEKDPGLERRFQPVRVPQPTVEEAIQITTVLAKGNEVNKADNGAEEGSDLLLRKPIMKQSKCY